MGKRRMKKSLEDLKDYLESLNRAYTQLYGTLNGSSRILRGVRRPHKSGSRLVKIGAGLMFLPAPVVSEVAGAALIGLGVLVSMKEKPTELTDLEWELVKALRRLKLDF